MSVKRRWALVTLYYLLYHQLATHQVTYSSVLAVDLVVVDLSFPAYAVGCPVPFVLFALAAEQ